jgi:hypothetical protein
MSDRQDSVADDLGPPAYSEAKDETETIAKKCAMNKDGARIVGICTGAAASFQTVITTAMP